jgi:hypothetical protein
MSPLISFLRNGRARIALATALCSLALPAAAHADLVQSAPTGVDGSLFDDHSIGGDNHMGWGYSGSDPEPLEVNFSSTLTNASGTLFRVCGYPSGTSGWMRAFQVASATCPGSPPSATENGWFRYITANHSDDAPPTFNRWHLMDLQRFALVPLPGSPGHTIAWDTDWGTCLADNAPDMQCVQTLGASSLSTSIGAGTTKLTQEDPSAPDAVRIGIPSGSRFLFPDGAYQVVAISNPYGRYAGASNVACTNITISGYTADPIAPVVVEGGQPSTCYVPATLQPALTGPGGRDPVTGESPTTPTCPLTPTGHCWTTVPMSGTNPLARTNVTPANAIDASGALVTVPQGGALVQGTTVAASPAAPVTPASVGAQTAAQHTLTARLARSYSRTAVRKVFGRRITRLTVACHVSSASTARCTVSFRKSGARYSGHLWLRYRTVRSRLRWQYRLEVKKRKSGHVQTIRRSYRTGGTL